MKEHPFSNQDKDAYRIAYLLAGYIRHRLTRKEHDELDKWLEESEHNLLLFEELTDEKNLAANLLWLDSIKEEEAYEKLEETIRKKPASHSRRRRAVWLAAATVVLLLGMYAALRYGQPGNKPPEKPLADRQDLPPGGDRATLRLEDGAVIDLANTHSGEIAVGQGSHVTKPADGEIVYGNPVQTRIPSPFHTLSTPVGGQYQVTLADGTRVWLNAQSSLQYPAWFGDSDRTVRLSGEAYFEVAHDGQRPFRVQMSDSLQVRVLGTHFNISAYQQDSVKAVTLLQGRVSVSSRLQEETLRPGEQLKWVEGSLKVLPHADTEMAVAWKNGLFVFHDAPIEEIMRQVARWYDAQIVYRGKINQLYNATIYRSESLSKLLHILEATESVHFKIENHVIYVSP